MIDDPHTHHRAPTDDGYSRPIAESRTRFGPDVLDRPDLYGNYDDEALAQLRRAVESRHTRVRVYRAVPPDHARIDDGDWVTLSRAYAHDHAYADGWPIVFADVEADRVFTDGNDPMEYGYAGPAQTGLATYGETDQLPPFRDPDSPATRAYRGADPTPGRPPRSPAGTPCPHPTQPERDHRRNR